MVIISKKSNKVQLDFYNEMRAKIQRHQLSKYICICNSLATDKDFIVLFIPPFHPNPANSGLYFIIIIAEWHFVAWIWILKKESERSIE